MCAAVRVMVAVAGISTEVISQCDFFKKGKPLLEAMVDRCVAGRPLRRGTIITVIVPITQLQALHRVMWSKRGRERELRLLLALLLSRLLMGSGLLDTLPTHMKTIRSVQ